MSRVRRRFVCQECGYDVPKWSGRCPGCNEWNTMSEETIHPQRSTAGKLHASLPVSSPMSIASVNTEDAARFSSGYGEFDRVLGSGWLPGSVTLLVGDPGVGKSSLTLQASACVARDVGPVLYVSGEESVRQVRLRADRLEAVDERLFVIGETDVVSIAEHVDHIEPSLLVIDSIQTIFHPDIESAPGGVSQVRECATHLMQIAKAKGIAAVLVGHVTKDGNLAGPRVLEHIVDAALYLEGDRHSQFRILRAVKNRFGNTNEIGLFDMREEGLVEVPDGSHVLLAERPTDVSGSIIVPTVEGTRPLLVELQALVTPSPYTPPRRTADGIDLKKVHLMIAVMDKRASMSMGHADVFVKVTGGLSIAEPAADLGLAVALASSFRDKPPAANTVVFGEVGLAGEVRAVSQAARRLQEAQKMGLRRGVVPQGNLKGMRLPAGIEVVGVETVIEAFSVIFES